MKISKRKLSSTVQLLFLKRLSRVLANGYSLIAALETLKWDKRLNAMSENIIAYLKNGKSLDQALEEMKFHQLISTYLYFAKEYGDLESSISKCAEIVEKRIQYYKKFEQVIRYPIILMFIVSIVFFFIQHKVLPNLLLLFEQNAQHSSTIPILITVSSVLYYGFILLIVVFFLSRWIWQGIKKNITIKSQLKFYNLLPFYRNYLKLNTSYQFSTHVSSLLKSGLSIKDVLSILSKQSKHPIISYYASILTSGLSRGIHVSLLMNDLSFINPQLAAIFQKNTNTESLEKDLSIYAVFLTDELNQKIIKAITYIQPLFFLLLGLVIVLIYLSLMLPMYQMIETI